VGREKEVEMEMEMVEMEMVEEMEEVVQMEMEEMDEMVESSRKRERVRLHITKKKKRKRKRRKSKENVAGQEQWHRVRKKSLTRATKKKITLPKPSQTSRTSNKKPLALFPQTRNPQMTERRRQSETKQLEMIF